MKIKKVNSESIKLHENTKVNRYSDRSLFKINNKKTNVMVECRKIGNKYNINEITDYLEVLLSNSWSEGDIIEKNGKIRECTCWEYSTDINLQLVKVYDTFYGKRNRLVKVKESYKLEFTGKL